LFQIIGIVLLFALVFGSFLISGGNLSVILEALPQFQHDPNVLQHIYIQANASSGTSGPGAGGMKVGVPSEIKTDEYRVALTPAGVRELVDAGVPVALGSDCSPNSWVESMPLVLSFGVYGARLTPAEALTAATVNAAHAVGAADVAGRIAVGRPAEFVAFDLPSVEGLGYRIGLRPTAVLRQGFTRFSR